MTGRSFSADGSSPSTPNGELSGTSQTTTFNLGASGDYLTLAPVRRLGSTVPMRLPDAEPLLTPLGPWFDRVKRTLPWRSEDLDRPHPTPTRCWSPK